MSMNTFLNWVIGASIGFELGQYFVLWYGHRNVGYGDTLWAWIMCALIFICMLQAENK